MLIAEARTVSIDVGCFGADAVRQTSLRRSHLPDSVLALPVSPIEKNSRGARGGATDSVAVAPVRPRHFDFVETWAVPTEMVFLSERPRPDCMGQM